MFARVFVCIVLLGTTVGLIARPAPTSTWPRLVTAAEHTRRLALLPTSGDKVLDQLKADPKLVWYDDATTPPIFQHWRPTDDTGFVFGLVPTAVNISANKSELFGNANREFPWSATAGLRLGDPVLHFVILPTPAKLHWTGGRESRLVWTYPNGTTFGEMILVEHPKTKKSFVTEVRLRQKVAGAWTATAYRPFPTVEHLDAAARADLPPGDDRATLLNALAKPVRTVMVMKNRHPGRTTIDATGTWEYLPAISAEAVEILLDRPFENALGLAWRDDGEKAPCHAPSTKADFHVVPKNYDAGAVAVGVRSCNRCHDSTQANADEFENRDWYGRVRGSDTILTFSPFRKELGMIRHTPSRDNIVDPALLGTLFEWSK